MRIRRQVEALGAVEAAAAAPGAEQGVEDGHGAQALGVVAVPGDVAAGMDDDGRGGVGHLFVRWRG
jgi:hypothetical protein